MNNKLVTALLLLALLVFASAGQTLAQTRVPGVQTNDNFLYGMISYWSSSDPYATVPSDLQVVNSTRSYNCTIANVNGSIVNSEDYWQFVNGTNTPAAVVQNVSSGQQYLMKGLVSIVCANLNVNDKLYDSAYDQRKINETVNIDYGTVQRDANAVISTNIPILNDSNSSIIGYGKTASYFDKETGILVIKADSTIEIRENVTIVMILSNTNRWPITSIPKIAPVTPTPSETSTATPGGIQIFGFTTQPLTLILIIAAITVVAVVVPVMLRRTHKRARRKRRR
jgi:hypothetical protein